MAASTFTTAHLMLGELFVVRRPVRAFYLDDDEAIDIDRNSVVMLLGITVPKSSHISVRWARVLTDRGLFEMSISDFKNDCVPL